MEVREKKKDATREKGELKRHYETLALAGNYQSLTGVASQTRRDIVIHDHATGTTSQTTGTGHPRTQVSKSKKKHGGRK